MEIQFKGKLFIIGGGANTVLKSFVKLAGGKRANIALIPHASLTPVKASKELSEALTKLGAGKVNIILPRAKKVSTLPPGTTAVYLMGGDQNRLMERLNPLLALAIETFLKNGGLVAGSSAGAAAIARIMIAGGMEDHTLRAGSLLIARGLGLLPGYIIDMHVKQHVRPDRLKAAISLVDNVIGLGLDEDTAICISRSKAQSYGAGHVRICQRTKRHRSNIHSSKEGKRISVFNVIESVITAGEEIKLP